MAIAQDIKQTSILLGTVDLTLGMPQQLVLNRLADQFDVRKYDDSNWFVYPKGRSASSLGTLVFTDQKLSAVFKDWGTNEQKASQLVIALYDVISGMLEAEKGRQSAAS